MTNPDPNGLLRLRVVARRLFNKRLFEGKYQLPDRLHDGVALLQHADLIRDLRTDVAAEKGAVGTRSVVVELRRAEDLKAPAGLVAGDIEFDSHRTRVLRREGAAFVGVLTLARAVRAGGRCE